MSLSSNARKNIHWNGISFQIPKQWVPASIEKNYLFFEHDGLPAFEIKWQRGQKKSVVSKTIKQLQAGTTRIDFDQPATRQNSSYEKMSFSWKTGSAQGKGAILYCETCRTVSLLQAFGEEDALNTILASLTDHPEDHMASWSILDIQFETPGDFCLQQFGFKPGHYQLTLTQAATTLIVQRWGPADLALKKSDLQTFAANAFGSGAKELEATSVNGFCGYSYACQEIAAKRKAVDFFRKNKYRSIQALWHDTSTNRLLAVKLLSQDDKTDCFETLCRSYVIVQD